MQRTLQDLTNAETKKLIKDLGLEKFLSTKNPKMTLTLFSEQNVKIPSLHWLHPESLFLLQDWGLTYSEHDFFYRFAEKIQCMVPDFSPALLKEPYQIGETYGLAKCNTLKLISESIEWHLEQGDKKQFDLNPDNPNVLNNLRDLFMDGLCEKVNVRLNEERLLQDGSEFRYDFESQTIQFVGEDEELEMIWDTVQTWNVYNYVAQVTALTMQSRGLELEPTLSEQDIFDTSRGLMGGAMLKEASTTVLRMGFDPILVLPIIHAAINTPDALDLWSMTIERFDGDISAGVDDFVNTGLVSLANEKALKGGWNFELSYDPLTHDFVVEEAALRIFNEYKLYQSDRIWRPLTHPVLEYVMEQGKDRLHALEHTLEQNQNSKKVSRKKNHGGMEL